MKTNWPALRNGCLIFTSLACGAAPLLAQSHDAAEVARGGAVISSVAVTQASARSSVRVEGEGELYARPTRMQNPDRLVLDFTGTRMAVQKTAIPGVSAPVRGVRLGQYRPDVARVVIDLTASAPYQIAHEGNALVISFDTQDSQVVSSTPTLTAAAETKPAFHYSEAAPRNSNRRQPSVTNVSAPKFNLPTELTKGAGFGSFAGSSQPARPDETSTQQAAAQQAVQQASNAAATVAPVAQQASTASAASTPVKYTGEPISVNLKDVDLRDFFRLIHEISGLNVVLDPAVKGSLTIVLDEVPWDQALDIVLQNNGLDKQLRGNVLRIATRETLRKEAESVRDLEKAQDDATQAVTVTRVLSYAKASALTATLKRFLSPKGDILADERSNQLIIRDIPSTIPTVDNLIHQLDRKSQQVEIEARVVAASRSFARDIGTELGFAGTTTGGRSLFSGDPRVGGSGVTTGAGIPPPPISVGGGTTTGNNVNTGLPLNTNFGWRTADQRLRLFAPFAEFRDRLLYQRRRIQGRRKAALQTPHRYAEQRKGERQAGYQGAHPDDHQQHGFGAVHRRGTEARSHSADYRRGHRVYGRAGGKHPDRQRYRPRSGHPGVGYSIGRNQGAGR